MPALSRRESYTLDRAATADSALLPRMCATSAMPDLAAFRPRQESARQIRARVDTRALIERARRPWSLTRICLVFVAIVAAILTTYSGTGESAQPLMFSQAVAGAGPVTGIPWPVNAITAKVQPATQLKRVDLYDTQAQFNQWGGAACSAAALSEVLTAYGVPNASIGRMIDELGTDISPSWGLVTYDGFSKVAALHGLRANIYTDQLLTYPQMQYLTNTLGIPVIVNVRISYGYYHFFSGGHFMVMTYGDAQGVRLVDSSLYYVQYLPMDVFRSMFTGRTAVIVSKDMQYTLPT